MLQILRDEQIIQMIQSDDSKKHNKALTTIRKRNVRTIRRLINSDNGQEGDYQIIIDDSLLDLMQFIRSGRFDSNRGSINTLLNGIARNKWSDLKRKRNNRIDKDKLPLYEIDNDGLIDEALISEDAKTQITSALRKLEPCCRELLHDIYFKEIAQVTYAELRGLPPERVRKHLQRCRAAFKKIMNNKDPRMQ